jgi:hypothetical protein
MDSNSPGPGAKHRATRWTVRGVAEKKVAMSSELGAGLSALSIFEIAELVECERSCHQD